MWRFHNPHTTDSDKALFMEVTDEQRQLAQQARAYGEQMQALTDTNGAKRKVGLNSQFIFQNSVEKLLL